MMNASCHKRPRIEGVVTHLKAWLSNCYESILTIKMNYQSLSNISKISNIAHHYLLLMNFMVVTAMALWFDAI